MFITFDSQEGEVRICTEWIGTIKPKTAYVTYEHGNMPPMYHKGSLLGLYGGDHEWVTSTPDEVEAMLEGEEIQAIEYTKEEKHLLSALRRESMNRSTSVPQPPNTVKAVTDLMESERKNYRQEIEDYLCQAREVQKTLVQEWNEEKEKRHPSPSMDPTKLERAAQVLFNEAVGKVRARAQDDQA